MVAEHRHELWLGDGLIGELQVAVASYLPQRNGPYQGRGVRKAMARDDMPFAFEIRSVYFQHQTMAPIYDLAKERPLQQGPVFLGLHVGDQLVVGVGRGVVDRCGAVIRWFANACDLFERQRATLLFRYLEGISAQSLRFCIHTRCEFDGQVPVQPFNDPALDGHAHC